jgi:hypothetical protein
MLHHAHMLHQHGARCKTSAGCDVCQDHRPHKKAAAHDEPDKTARGAQAEPEQHSKHTTSAACAVCDATRKTTCSGGGVLLERVDGYGVCDKSSTSGGGVLLESVDDAGMSLLHVASERGASAGAVQTPYM